MPENDSPALPVADEETLCDLADLFKIFGDTTRIRILHTLMQSSRCVGEIAGVLGMTQSAISHQLRLLKNANLVATAREGKTIRYSLADDHVRTIVGQGLDHISERTRR
jgi:ArsR family transcriptional regulator